MKVYATTLVALIAGLLCGADMSWYMWMPVAGITGVLVTLLDAEMRELKRRVQ